jgi:hypothetical protein
MPTRISARLGTMCLLIGALISCQHPTRGEQVGEFIEAYFRYKQPERVAWFMSEVWKLDLNLGGVSTTIGFLAEIFRQNPDRLQSWSESASNLSSQHQWHILRAFWYADTPQSRHVLAEAASGASGMDPLAASKLLKDSPPPLDAIPIRIGADLDFLWGGFAASGGRKYVSQVVAVMGWPMPEDLATRFNETRLRHALLPDAAKWSLTSHARQFHEVRVMLRDEFETSTGKTRKMLGEILMEIAGTDPTFGPPARESGDLAVLVAASKNERFIKDWISRDLNRPVSIERAKEIRPDQMVHIAFLVTGFTLDDSRRANLIVHASFYDPKGRLLFDVPEPMRISGGGKHMERPTFAMAFPTIDLVLEESDPQGAYTIEATVKDLVTNKVATSQYQLTLVKGNR